MSAASVGNISKTEVILRSAQVGLSTSAIAQIVVTQVTQGIRGEPGPIGDAGGAFLVVNRFAEIASNDAAKAQARQNLDLQNIDGGTFF